MLCLIAMFFLSAFILCSRFLARYIWVFEPDSVGFRHFYSKVFDGMYIKEYMPRNLSQPVKQLFEHFIATSVRRAPNQPRQPRHSGMCLEVGLKIGRLRRVEVEIFLDLVFRALRNGCLGYVTRVRHVMAEGDGVDMTACRMGARKYRG